MMDDAMVLVLCVVCWLVVGALCCVALWCVVRLGKLNKYFIKKTYSILFYMPLLFALILLNYLF